MNTKLIEENKIRLLDEQKRILENFQREDVVDPEIPGGFKPKFTEVGREEGENASEVEQFQNDLGVMKDLEARLKAVEAALARIDAGTYGTCSVGAEEIDEDRLRAEPAAETCIQHSQS